MNWVYHRVESYLPENLSVQKLEGSLLGPVTVNGFKYQQDGTVIKAEQITLNWQPTALLAANINVSQFHIKSLDIVSAQN